MQGTRLGRTPGGSLFRGSRQLVGYQKTEASASYYRDRGGGWGGNSSDLDRLHLAVSASNEGKRPPRFIKNILEVNFTEEDFSRFKNEEEKSTSSDCGVAAPCNRRGTQPPVLEDLTDDFYVQFVEGEDVADDDSLIDVDHLQYMSDQTGGPRLYYRRPTASATSEEDFSSSIVTTQGVTDSSTLDTRFGSETLLSQHQRWKCCSDGWGSLAAVASSNSISTVVEDATPADADLTMPPCMIIGERLAGPSFTRLSNLGALCRVDGEDAVRRRKTPSTTRIGPLLKGNEEDNCETVRRMAATAFEAKRTKHQPARSSKQKVHTLIEHTQQSWESREQTSQQSRLSAIGQNTAGLRPHRRHTKADVGRTLPADQLSAICVRRGRPKDPIDTHEAAVPSLTRTTTTDVVLQDENDCSAGVLIQPPSPSGTRKRRHAASQRRPFLPSQIPGAGQAYRTTKRSTTGCEVKRGIPSTERGIPSTEREQKKPHSAQALIETRPDEKDATNLPPGGRRRSKPSYWIRKAVGLLTSGSDSREGLA